MDWTLILKKFHYLVTPVGMITILTVLAILFALFQKGKFSVFIMGIALSILWIASTPWVSILAAKKLLSDKIIEVPFDALPNADAIVVYSWMEPFEHDQQAAIEYSSRKLNQVIKIHDKQKIPIIGISSQFPPPRLPENNEITFTRNYLNRFGIKDNFIHIPRASRNTREAAMSAKKVLDELNCKRFILVAWDLRMPREYLTFKKLFDGRAMEIIPYSNLDGHPSYGLPNYSIKHWIPNTKALNLTTSILHDWTGLIAYKMLGWI